MAKWYKFAGEKTIFSPKTQRMLGFVFRKVDPVTFADLSDQEVYDAVSVMAASGVLKLEIKIKADGSVETRWETKLPTKSDVRDLIERQGVGLQGLAAK